MRDIVFAARISGQKLSWSGLGFRFPFTLSFVYCHPMRSCQAAPELRLTNSAAAPVSMAAGRFCSRTLVNMPKMRKALTAAQAGPDSGY
jgi:hypothetical protein